MSQAPNRSAGQIRRGLQRVCVRLEIIRSTLADRPAEQREALERLADGSATESQVAADLETVDRALQASGDHLGVFGRVRRSGNKGPQWAGGFEGLAPGVGMVSATGVDRDNPAESVLRCPRSYQCDRFAQPDAGPEPLCELTGAALRYDELSP